MNELSEKKYFCILPWTHFSLGSNGDVHRCCRTDYALPLGNIKKNSIAEIWNNDNFKKLREDMSKDIAVDACQYCYDLEKKGVQSLRQFSNNEWRDYHYRVEETKNNVDLKFEPVYLDLRFSNICNFKCRTCGPELSTSWYADFKSATNHNFRTPHTISNENDLIWDELIAILPSVKRIYFAGGEPLLHKDHYRLLEELLKLGLTDVKLVYNTNLSVLSLGANNVLNLWQNFKYIMIGASLDGIEKKGEYIRSGLDWNVFFKNRKIVQVLVPHAVFNIQWTLSVLNVFHITEAMTFFSEKNFLESAKMFELDILYTPYHYSIKILTSKEREALKKHYEHFLQTDYLGLKIKEKESFKKNLEYILSLLEHDYFDNERNNFVEITKKLDGLRNENFLNLFPELNSLYK